MGTALAAASWRASVGSAEAQQLAIEVVHPPNPYAALLRHIEPGLDDFPGEKVAYEIAGHLSRLIETPTLPLAPGFTGQSLVPAGYRAVGPGADVAEFAGSPAGFPDEFRRWRDSLGDVVAARFFVLPGDRVRYEISTQGHYRVGYWRQRWVDGQLAEFRPLEETRTRAGSPLFTDVTGHAFSGVASFRDQLMCGIPFWRAHLDAATGIDVHGHNGIAVGDIDNTGFDAVYVCQPAGLPNRLYRNRGDGTFEDVTERSGLGILDATSSALFADFRNSGRQDLVVLRPDGPLLFLNQGEGRFELRPNAFRFRTAPQGNFTSMAAADYDRDGRLDLYLCSYSFFRDGGQYRYPSPYYDARNGPANFLFRNELTGPGSGSFIDVTEASGLNHNNDRFSLSAAWCDFNGDGWPDLCVANDFGRKNLYLNTNGTFRDVAAEAAADDPGAGMSASWFDYDGDGRPDLYLSNMWSDSGQRIVAEKSLEPADVWRRHPRGNTLLRNRGDGTFEDVSAAQNVEMGRWAWSSGGFDFDNDGTPEIFITAGMLTNESSSDLESFFWRHVATAPAKSYEDGWNALSQAAHEKYSEAGHQPNVFLARRDGRYYDFSGVSGLDVAADSRAFAVTDTDGDGNPDLIVKNRLGPQVRVYQNNFAGGRNAISLRLQGIKSNRDAIGARVEVDGAVKFVEAGSGYLSQHTKTLHFGLAERTVARNLTVTWPSGETQRFANLNAGFEYDVTEGDAKVRPTPFKVRGEVPSSPVTGNNTSVLSDTWLLEPLPLPEPFKGPGVLHLPATLKGPRAEWYALLVRYLFDLRADLRLPAWLTVDARNRITRISFTEPRAGDTGSPLPFPGRYITPPTRNYSALGAAFFAAGHPEQALRYLEFAPQDNARTVIAIGKIHLSAGRNSEARRYLERATSLDPNSADAWNTLGAVAVGEGNIARALETFEKALAINPNLASALINAGQAHGALGHTAQAETVFQRALEQDPKDAVAANQMGELLARTRREAEARQWFQRAIASRRDYAPAINNLAALYRRAGQLDEAIAAYRYGIDTVPLEEAFYLNLASLYAASNLPDAARATLEKLLDQNPQSQQARRALNELDRR